MNDLFQTLGESIKQIDFTHAFLGLTKGKSPDELDKADETLRQEYLKNKEFYSKSFNYKPQVSTKELMEQVEKI
ncbi:hypothetical protein AEI18_03945 [Campylobacter jejuni]|uniref:hypothetical protein n=1 Tax=Campylobacter jejuni TaxID=197 RepID=UPI0021AF79FC|nr:hypothetical protein [Campylobacter jejuni]UWN21236.1 hypothetical protein AEI18_03945 [Campylobacter jejuni]